MDRRREQGNGEDDEDQKEETKDMIVPSLGRAVVIRVSYWLTNHRSVGSRQSEKREAGGLIMVPNEIGSSAT